MNMPNDHPLNQEAEAQLVMFRRVLVSELMGGKCRCGDEKKPHNAFCRSCYLSLPYNLRADLYKPLGRGYEQAYENACRALDRVSGMAAGAD